MVMPMIWRSSLAKLCQCKAIVILVVSLDELSKWLVELAPCELVNYMYVDGLDLHFCSEFGDPDIIPFIALLQKCRQQIIGQFVYVSVRSMCYHVYM